MNRHLRPDRDPDLNVWLFLLAALLVLFALLLATKAV